MSSVSSNIINNLNKFLVNDKFSVNAILVISIVGTIITPYLSKSLNKFVYSDLYRVIVLLVLLYLYYKKFTLPAIIVLLFFVVTQLSSTQQASLKSQENYTPVDTTTVHSKPLDIPESYFKPNGSDSLEGNEMDVKPRTEDDYLMYKTENKHDVPSQVDSTSEEHSTEEFEAFNSSSNEAPF